MWASKHVQNATMIISFDRHHKKLSMLVIITSSSQFAIVPQVCNMAIYDVILFPFRHRLMRRWFGFLSMLPRFIPLELSCVTTLGLSCVTVRVALPSVYNHRCEQWCCCSTRSARPNLRLPFTIFDRKNKSVVGGT
jgi:hypothetical protein